MKVLTIYDSECRPEVEKLRKEITDRFGKKTILKIKKPEGPHLKHSWHRDAVRMIKLADMVVYVVSEHSAKNSNVEWEIKQSLAHNKYILCLKLSEDAALNKSLYVFDKNLKDDVCLADIAKSKEDIFETIESFNKDSYIKLTNDDYDVNILLEQYKIFSSSAESLVERRQNMNSFYISANTALITIAATTFALSESSNIIPKLAIVLALSIPGVLLNVSWQRTMQSYYLNNRGKMKVLSMMEKHLAALSYDAEWKAMKNRYSKERYVSFTENERKLPLVFILCYLLADLSAAFCGKCGFKLT